MSAATDDVAPAEVLRRGLARQGLAVCEAAQARLMAYLDLLGRWNRVYNLTAVRDPVECVIRHLLDSLAVLPYVRGPRLLDVGSGAGLPGIPLAIALSDSMPDLEVVLLDSNAKKTRFLTQALAELGLTNARVVRCRVEDYHPAQLFDTVISRAFAALDAFVTAAAPLCRQGGRLLAMKGPLAPRETVGGGHRVVAIHPLRVPGLEGARCLVEIEPAVPGGDRASSRASP